MSSGFSIFKLTPVVAGVVFVLLAGANGQEALPRRGRAIEFSEPKRETVSTNLGELTAKKTTLQSLEEDLKKPFQIFNSGDSLGGVMAPPMGRPAEPVIQSKRVKALLEKHKDWVFQTPEEMIGAMTVEEILKVPEYGPDGEKKEKASPLTRYYERLDKTGSASTNRFKSDLLPGLFPSMDPRNDTLMGDRPGRAGDSSSDSDPRKSSGLRGLIDPASDRSAITDADKAGSFSDLFGGGNPGAQDWTRAQQDRLEEFKRLLDSSSPQTPAAGRLVGSMDSAQPTPAFNSPEAYSSSGAGAAPGPPAPGIGTWLPRPTVPEATASPAYPSLTPTLPLAIQPAPPPPAPVQFSIPKRAF